MKYQVVRIDEDIDFGCEERASSRRHPERDDGG